MLTGKRQKILIVNPFGIGDVLFSTPLLSSLKSAWPDSYVGYICNVRAKDVLYDNPAIDKIFVFEKDEYKRLWQEAKISCVKKLFAFIRQIKKRRFDIAIDLSLGHKYSLFLRLIGVKKRIGYNYRERGRFLTDKIDIEGYEKKPVAEYYLDLLRFIRIEPQQFPLTVTTAEADKAWAEEFLRDNAMGDEDLIIGIIPAGGASWGKNFSYRHWPWENYAVLADKLINALQAKVIIFGAPSEEKICLQLQRQMREKAVNACGKTSLKRFAALLAKCKMVVCNDGGPLHVAVSQNVRTVSIFGPVDEKVYGPYPPDGRHIVVTKQINCRPCYQRFKLPECPYQRRCIRDISAQEVFDIIRTNLTVVPCKVT